MEVPLVERVGHGSACKQGSVPRADIAQEKRMWENVTRRTSLL
jgi:hypothetical protein